MSRPLQILACALTLLGGCRKTEMLQINLPPGFTGKVEIACNSQWGYVASLNVDPEGHSAEATCPKHATDVILMRDGKRIAPVGPVDWPATGDGFPVAIRFSVR